jgi:ATP synthase F1 complex assembly factor 2
MLPTDVMKREHLLPRRPGSAEFKDAADWYGVTLDGRVVKTPLGQILAVPSEMLAWAIAAEWDAQEISLRPAQMPLMTLVCTALDQTAPAPEVAQANSLLYLPTDTVCYWADPLEDRLLYKKQKELWDGIHDHCELLFGDRAAAAIGANEGLIMSRVRGQKSLGLPHSTKLVSGAQQFVRSLDAWHLTALSVVAAEAKSFLAATALLSRGLLPMQAADAARVEEEFQITIWGMVEGQHDYDRLNCSIQMHAAHMLVSSIAIDNCL